MISTEMVLTKWFAHPPIQNYYNPTIGENLYSFSISDPNFRDYANHNPNPQLASA
jgi:hypothetical protein